MALARHLDFSLLRLPPEPVPGQRIRESREAQALEARVVVLLRSGPNDGATSALPAANPQTRLQRAHADAGGL